MSARNPNLRETMNNGVVQQLADCDRQMSMGSLMGLLIRAMTPTEAAAAVAANAKTLAQSAAAVFDVVATAGGSTGRKVLLIGGPELVPAAGQVVWDGDRSMRFAAADAVTAADFKYARKDGVDSETSLGNRILGERD